MCAYVLELLHCDFKRIRNLAVTQAQGRVHKNARNPVQGRDRSRQILDSPLLFRLVLLHIELRQRLIDATVSSIGRNDPSVWQNVRIAPLSEGSRQKSWCHYRVPSGFRSKFAGGFAPNVFFVAYCSNSVLISVTSAAVVAR